MEELAVSEPLHLSAYSIKEEAGKKCSNGKVYSTSFFQARERGLVCVTSGNSFLGSHIVKELLAHGFLVRVTIQNYVDFEDMEEFLEEDEMNMLEGVVVVKMQDLQGLCEAFSGCHVVFHTSSFIDPHGVSGYSEGMAFLESQAASNVIEACGRAAYVRRCILTASLLSSIWVDDNLERSVNEDCWSNEEFCRENKLWLALGKTRAEKAAWKKSKEWKVNLVTVCPGLLMETSFPYLHHPKSLPYLKGGPMMLQRGVLATAEVRKVAEAHVLLYKAMDLGASGRYLCFDKLVLRMEEAIQLENQLKVEGLFSSGGTNYGEPRREEEIKCKLSNSRLTKLLLQTSERESCKTES